MVDDQQQGQRLRRRRRHKREDRRTPAQGQRQAQAPEARRENAASRATGIRIADNAPCPVHPGAGHTWGECRENARNRATNNNNNRNNAAQGASGGQRRGRQQPPQRGEAQGHFVETIDGTMEQEDVSDLPGGPTEVSEVSDPAPMVLDEEEQLIIDESAPSVAAAESFSALSLTDASPPSVDSTGRPTPVHHIKPSQWAAKVPLAPATPLQQQSQWGHYKPPSKPTVPRKQPPTPSAATVKKAPPVAAPQPPLRDETPAPSETGNGEYILPVFYVAPFGTAVVMQETHHLDLFSFPDSFLEQSLDPYGISMETMMFPSTALPQPIARPIPSYQTITIRSCASSGSALTNASAKEGLKWPEASLRETTICTGRSVTAAVSQIGSTNDIKPVGITALMSSMPPQTCKRSKDSTQRLNINNSTSGATSNRMITVTPSKMSWTLLEPEDKNTSVDCFTTTTGTIPCCPTGHATTTSILRCGPKRARTSSRKVSFHSKTQESIGTKSQPSSIISKKKQGTRSDSTPFTSNPRKSSTSTTCSKSTSQTAGQALRLPNQVEPRQRSPLTQNCRQLLSLTHLTESELEGLCASILTETFPEVCITDAVIPDPRENMDLEPTALQWRDPTSNTFSPSSQLVPISLATVQQFSGVSAPTPLVVLFDSGSQLSFLKCSKVPKECEISTVAQPVRGLTGTLHLTEEVTLMGITLPEFSASKRIDSSLRCLLLDKHQEDSTYDMILGLDFLCAVGINILCCQKQLKWDEATMAFQPRDTYKEPQANLHARLIEAFPYGDEEDDPEGLSYKSTQIMEAKYEAIDTDELAQAQKQLTPTQRTELAHLFRKFPQLFDGELRTYPHHQYHLDLQDGTKPVHSRPYRVPFTQRDAFKRELDHLVKIGVLERSGASQWASGTFIIPKKDGRVCWISDFCALNKCIKRKTYLLLRISEILSKRTGYAYFSKLDISMAYYTFELDDESKDLCTINTPYGLYRYRVLPLGVAQSPDFCQETMEHVLQGVMDADVYIDDIGCFGKSWQQHLQVLEQVMTRLQDNGFSVNPRKCEWAVQETDFLGYWLTPTGLKPWRKKIDAILRLQRPRTVKDLRSFIGAVTYYRMMFPNRAHILAPLTALTSQKSGNVAWSAECQHAFDTIKAILSSDVLLRYPDHNQPFHVYTDASNLQLGAVIVQDERPVAYYSRKLNAAQRNYTTMEKELLSIVETLKEFRTMLFGCRELHVWTDHKNLTYTTLNSQRVLRWHLFLEDFHPTFHYIPGEHNSLADALSRLPSFGRQDPDAALALSPVEAMLRSKLDRAGQAFDPFATPSPEAPSAAFSGYSMAMDDPSLVDWFVNLPPLGNVPLPLSFEACAAAQAQDATLQQKLATDPARYVQNQLAPNANVICYLSQPNAPWKICIPDSKLDEIIQWHHTHLGHPGIKRTSDTIALHYYHPRLSARCEDLISHCDACQRNKPSLRVYGELPPRNAINTAWQEVAIDLIGPWMFTVNGASYTFHALTMIDTVTNYCELIRIDKKSAAHVGLKFENEWLSRYPHPQSCTYDQGNEFLGHGFQQHLRRYNIHSKVSTVKNPQSNAVAERLHQTVTNILRSSLYANPPDNQLEAELLIDMALQKAAYAMHATVHTTLKATPGSLVYQQDMILNIPVVADLLDITARRQQLIDERTMAENRK